MLYNPKWDQVTPLDQFIAWLETKDSSETYDWRSRDVCACGQFYGSGAWLGQPGFKRLNSIAHGNGHASDRADWTFGKCLERAKKYREWERLGILVPCSET
jgi:hypothetical protein